MTPDELARLRELDQKASPAPFQAAAEHLRETHE